MTGVYCIYKNGKHYKDVEIIPMEIYDDLVEWFENANSGDEFKIVCDCA